MAFGYREHLSNAHRGSIHTGRGQDCTNGPSLGARVRATYRWYAFSPDPGRLIIRSALRNRVGCTAKGAYPLKKFGWRCSSGKTTSADEYGKPRSFLMGSARFLNEWCRQTMCSHIDSNEVQRCGGNFTNGSRFFCESHSRAESPSGVVRGVFFFVFTAPL